MGIKNDVSGRLLNSIDINPNSPKERSELLMLEAKAGHDGLHDERLNISKQLLPYYQ